MMPSSIDEFQSNLELLPNTLQKKYALLRDLDRSLQELVRQNEQHCEQEIEDIKRQVKSGSLDPDHTQMSFSDGALDEQKHSIRIADEKVTLAIQAYDLVDAHIQQLDQYLRKNYEEELCRQKETALLTGLADPNADNSTKSGRNAEGSREQDLQHLQQLLHSRQVWTWTYRWIQMNRHIVTATKLAMGRWSHVITQIAG